MTDRSVMTAVCRPMSACGTLKVEAGSVRRWHSSPPRTVRTPPSGANTTHSPGPTAGVVSVNPTDKKIVIIIGLSYRIGERQRSAAVTQRHGGVDGTFVEAGQNR